MEIISILNQKGGSCKTSVSVNLAAALAEKGKRVLLIDLDPQASASIWLGFRNPSKELFTLFTENDDNIKINSIIKNTSIDGLDLIAASPWLISADKTLAGEVGAETILKQKIEAIEVKSWDYVLIDNQPSLGIMSLNALTASHSVLVPLEPHIMAVGGLAQLIQTISAVKGRLNDKLELEGIVPCRVNNRTKLAQEIIQDLRKRFGNKVYTTFIRENVKVAECVSFSKPVNIYDTKSAGAEDFRNLANEFLKRRKDRTKK